MLVQLAFSQCPVSNLNLTTTMETDSTAEAIDVGKKLNVTCKHEHRAFHPADKSLGITGNSSSNVWSIECDMCTNNFSLPKPSRYPKCKCIVSSALQQFSSSLESKNYTTEPLEGTDPINVGDKITFKCKEDEAEAGNTMSNNCKLVFPCMHYCHS